MIRGAYCGICGSDIAACKTDDYVVGLAIGHEFSGTIEKVDSKVESLAIGKTVTGSDAITGRMRISCLGGKPSLCERWKCWE